MKKVIVTTFKEAFRDEKNILDMRKNKTAAGFRQEGLGIWSQNGKGLYTRDLIDMCYRIGDERGTIPMCSRHDDWETNAERRKMIHYFLAGDPAKADTKKADDGALVVLRAAPRVEHPTGNLVDWQLDFVWAHLVRRADAPQWAAIMHRKHRQFDFSGVILDGGAGGGGNWIKPELAKATQIIRDRETKVRKIACEEDEATISTADFILSMFKTSDAKIQKLWGDTHNLRGDDVIIDAAHTEFLQAIELGIVGLPKRYRDWPRDQVDTWSEEKKWASQFLDKGALQLTRCAMRTNDDGTTYYNSHRAREFSARGKKDFAYAMLYAFVRFLQWVKSFDDDEGAKLTDEEYLMCE